MTVRVLLVSHEATRTGAPRVAVEIATALRHCEEDDVIVLLRWPGPLSPELAANSSRFVLEPLRRVRAVLRMLAPNAKLVNRLEELIAYCVLRRYRPDVAYLNTVKSACYARPALRLGIPVILHVHELEPLASSTLARYHLDDHFSEIQLVACSDAVCVNLARLTGVRPGEIRVIPSVPDAERILRLAGNARPSAIRRHDGELVVGACARADERKGIDLWLEAVRRVVDDDPFRPTRFVWVGSYEPDAVALAGRIGVGDNVEFLGETDNPYPAIAAMDVFTLPSREDPFPLVVLEAMSLGKPVVAFDVGGVRQQLGSVGLLVPPEDVCAFGDAIVELLQSSERRGEMGESAAARARLEYGIDRFRVAVQETARKALGSHNFKGLVRFAAREHEGQPQHAFLLWAFGIDSSHAEAGSEQRWVLPYCADAITETGFELELSDRHRRWPWTAGTLRAVLSALERLTAPFLQAALAAKSIGGSDVTIAMFESQGNALAALRTLRIAPFTRPRFAVVTCWLSRDLEWFGPVRRTLYRRAYRSVDDLFFFSSNQAQVFERFLGMPSSRLHSVPFGVDHTYFTPRPGAEEDFVLSVGRDLGRDWPTFLDAVRGTELHVKIACRDRTLAQLDVPPNVDALGYVDRDSYRELLARARVVVVATRDLPYPTGQTVTLEAMAMGKCCVVTDTVPMREYLRNGENALLVPAGDASALRAAVLRALDDGELRAAIGRSARRSIEEEFNAPLMWHRIGKILGS